MKDEKKIELLLKVIEIIHDQNPGTEKVIDPLMVEVSSKECVSPEQVYFHFIFLFCCFYSKKNIEYINILCVFQKQV